ncbi:MAG: 5-formyltetrahydrofolate cyclo-ligase [Peptococcaceae bacterium]|nr:5-formyltetrahydrofolate cyclo-ligase [Peptococcaceae bacterium]
MHQDIRLVKNQLRQQYKQIRNRLTADQVISYSDSIARQLFATDFWQQSSTVMLYLSFQNEVITEAIYQRGWQEGKTMLLPICAPEGGLMEMSVITSFDQLEPNRYGIGELPEHLQQLIAPEQIDVCLIPGIAFDHAGTRLGFGAGYYDRYLPRVNPSAKRIALAYECQMHSETLPRDAYDLPMQYILTERKLYQIDAH